VVERSSKFISLLSSILWKKFPGIMEHLEEVRKVEDIPIDEGRFGGTAFTSMATTMDYNVNIHRDIDDYSWSFIISIEFEDKNLVFNFKLL
jgi:hypothetical protein